jgi:NAD(P)-dependent dehydrogenase (short-subunit alcohol dehydrogenase family)
MSGSGPETSRDNSVPARKVAVVTGGARGIGRACAVRLAEQGCDVAIADLIEPADTAHAVRAAGARALPVVCDVAVPADITRTIAAVNDEFGRCDVLVNNAGIFPRRMFDELDLELWNRVLAVNLTSAFLFCKAVVPGMTDRGFGRIINISSNTVGLPVEGMAHYIASKTAVIGFTQALAAEVGKHGITVNSVAPGATPTEGMLTGWETPALSAQRAQLFTGMAERQAVKRVSRPEDVANAVGWFASEQAAFVTAQLLVADGGLARL